jgi:uncharacterized RDD family membrane protein YckC
MQTLSAPSSENTLSSYAQAGIGDRVLAFIIDGFILGCYCPAMVWLLLDTSIDDMWAWFTFFLGPLLFYNLIFEIIMKGRTPGKRAAGIQVVTVEGETPSVGQYLIRWFFSIIGFYFLSGMIAIIVISANGKGQSFGDIVAGTKVVKRGNSFARNTFYQPVFPMAARLDGYDIELIKRALYAAGELDNAQPLTLVSEKIKSMLGVQTELSNEDFLAIVVKDFHHLSAR